jgi:hypothetical protein
MCASWLGHDKRGNYHGAERKSFRNSRDYLYAAASANAVPIQNRHNDQRREGDCYGMAGQ